MKKIIKFGDYSAILLAGEHRGILTINEKKLPVKLADSINEISGVRVNQVSKNDSQSTKINIIYDITAGEFLDVVCEAISRVYDADICVSDARPETFV